MHICLLFTALVFSHRQSNQQLFERLTVAVLSLNRKIRPQTSSYLTRFGLVWNSNSPAGDKNMLQKAHLQLREMENSRVTAATTSGLTAHACCPYSGITLVRVNRGAAGSGLDFARNRLLRGKHNHESEMVIMAPSTVQCIRHVCGCNYNEITEDGSHA